MKEAHEMLNYVMLRAIYKVDKFINVVVKKSLMREHGKERYERRKR
jgi:hypothetical protein